MVQFSDVGLRNLKTEGYHWDDKLPGFGVRVGKRTKTFICVRKGVRTSIGHFPHISLLEARKEALHHLHDPKPKQSSFILSEMIASYLSAIQVRPNTHRQYKLFLGKLERHYGAKPLDAITPRMCAEVIESPHMHLAVKIFFNWCKGQALLTVSPMENVKAIGKFQERSRVLTDEELKKVWIASEQLGRYGCIVRLCILTAQRRGEISQIKSEWLKENCLIIPAHVAKNGKEHTIPITHTSQTFSASLAQQSPTSAFNGWAFAKKNLDKLSGVNDWTIHDLRRTTATNLSKLGTDPFIVERILNHSMPKVQKIYNRHDFTEAMRAPLEKHEKWLLELVAKD
jgi:integrase